MSPRARKQATASTPRSPAARKQAALILEVLTGMRTTSEASEAMGVSVNRYYQLERRALDGLIGSLEPRRRGRALRSEDRIARLEAERTKLLRDVGRLQALLRAAQRAIGITAPSSSDGSKLGGTSKRRRRSAVRGKRVVLALRREAEASAPSVPEAKPSSSGAPEAAP
jgi:hypothetical protein